MARRVSEEDIKNFNEVYALCKSIRETAEATGWSEATVRKYVNKDYNAAPVIPEDFEINFPSIENTIDELQEAENLTHLTDFEERELKQLRKKMII